MPRPQPTPHSLSWSAVRTSFPLRLLGGCYERRAHLHIGPNPDAYDTIIHASLRTWINMLRPALETLQYIHVEATRQDSLSRPSDGH
jgi:hypothetical protein